MMIRARLNDDQSHTATHPLVTCLYQVLRIFRWLLRHSFCNLFNSVVYLV